MYKKDKYVCFQWIRDIRVKMNKDMEHMTPKERVAYIRAGADEVLRGLPKLSLEDARRQRWAVLHLEETVTKARTAKAKAIATAKTATRCRKIAKRLTPA